MATYLEKSIDFIYILLPRLGRTTLDGRRKFTEGGGEGEPCEISYEALQERVRYCPFL